MRGLPLLGASIFGYAGAMVRVLILLLTLGLGSLPLHAQGFWAKKDWRQWSERECRKILEDSPWARSRIIGVSVLRETGQTAPVDGRVSEPQITYVAQLWSALPVRQAAIRRVQLDSNFAKLPESDRKALEERHNRVLEADFADRIVIKVLISTNVPQYVQDLSRYLQNRPGDLWKQDTFLIAGSQRVPPAEVRVSPDGSEFQLIFPRHVNGQPVIRPGDKSFSLEFVHPTTGPLREQRVLLEFKVADLTMNQQTLF